MSACVCVSRMAAAEISTLTALVSREAGAVSRSFAGADAAGSAAALLAGFSGAGADFGTWVVATAR
ncbi:hypothetical protein N825_28065 [Skermanella stibiiresistens SB22]|uniref:Uncharacterized protein n=1 Tax=Skermanella stibiiresistens SB22 TaxID=1385369 RepID=W9HCA9_9PROT|nr:hypothetical protein N825_28065 [Skermanella stibiiresistens SB22]